MLQFTISSTAEKYANLLRLKADEFPKQSEQDKFKFKFISKIIPTNDPHHIPILVLINTRSGGGQGKEMLKVLQKDEKNFKLFTA